MQDRQHTANDALSSQGRQPSTRPRLGAPLVHKRDHPIENTLATLKRTTTRTKRANNQKLPNPGLSIKEREQTGKRKPDSLNPPRVRVIRLDHIPRSAHHTIVESSQKAILAIAIELIKRAPRNTSPLHHMRDSHTPNTTLTTHLNHRRENPRALDIHHAREPQTTTRACRARTGCSSQITGCSRRPVGRYPP